MIQAQSRELWFIYNDVLPEYRALPRTPEIDSLYATDLRSMWDAMARGLATAVACQRRIDSDARLAALLRNSPIRLAMDPRNPLRRASDFGRFPPSPSDSLFTLFDGLDRDSTGLLYTIRIGSFADSASTHRLVERFAWLGDLRESGGEWDSTIVLDWTHKACWIGDYERPTLFVLPPGVSGTNRWTVLSGLFVSRRDANRWLTRIRRRGVAAAQVVPIRVTGAVLSRAIRPS